MATRYLKACWIGIKQLFWIPEKRWHEDKIVGIVIRSGTVKELGHFCYVKVSISGKTMWAGGAEDRIVPYHSGRVVLPGDVHPEADISVDDKQIKALPRDMVQALGWTRDGQIYAYNYKGRVVYPDKAAIYGMDDAFTVVPPENHPDKWEVA